MARSEISIGGRRVGPGLPVYFIAEAGSNHDRNLEQAKRLIDVATMAGADAVKFQAFKADSLYPKRAGKSEYLNDSRSIYDVIRDLEMPIEWIPVLASYCADRGIHFLCTPFDCQSADALAPYVPAFKIASYDMTNYPLLQYVARKGKPMIVSTGTADLDEVREMIAALRVVGDVGLVVLQCTAKYPAPLDALNVRTVATMTELGVLTGLSDHSREPLPAVLAAVALGAVVVEKHFTLSNALPGPDHAYALEPGELQDLVAKARQVEATLGSGDKRVQAEEYELRAFARRTIFISRAMKSGERLGRADLSVLRCGTLPYGLHPKDYMRLFGRPVLQALDLEATLRFEHLGDLRLDDGDLSLRLVEKRDTEQLVAWRAHPEWAGPFFRPTSSRAVDSQDWLETASLRTDRIDFLIEAASRSAGAAGISDIDFVANRADFGLLFPETDRGRDGGLARRASALILDHGFETLGLKEIFQSIFVDDPWSQHLAESLGFVPLPIGARSHLDGDTSRPEVRLRLSSVEWARSRRPIS